MKKQYAILGLGRFGTKLARELFHKKQEVVIVDRDEAVVEKIRGEVTNAVVGDITNEDTLKEAGILDCDAVIIAESTDIESNIIAAQICKSLGIPTVICKAYNTVHGKILNKLGVDQIIFPEQDSAIKLANKLTSQGVLDYFDLGEHVNIIGTKPPKGWVGRKLSDLDLRTKHNITVLAVRRQGENLVIPAWSTLIEAEDILVLFGLEESFKQLNLDITHKT